MAKINTLPTRTLDILPCSGGRLMTFPLWAKQLSRMTSVSQLGPKGVFSVTRTLEMDDCV